MRCSKLDAAGVVGALEVEEAHDARVALLAARDGPVDDLLVHEERGPGGGDRASRTRRP